MGRRRTGVNKIRDIIRYGQTTDLSERQIARALGISRTVVARTLQTFRASGLRVLRRWSSFRQRVATEIGTREYPAGRRSLQGVGRPGFPRWSSS